MIYQLHIPNTDSEYVELDVSEFFGKPTLTHNGKTLWEVSAGTNLYRIHTADGRPINIEMRDSFFNEAPQLKFEDRTVVLSTPSTKVEKAIAFSPLAVFGVNALLGGINSTFLLFTCIPLLMMATRSLRLKSSSRKKRLILGASAILTSVLGLLVIASIFGTVSFEIQLS